MDAIRIVEIDCPVPRGKRDEICKKCALPLQHHQVRFEVMEHDSLYDVYALHPHQVEQADPNLSLDTRMLVLYASGKAFKKFNQRTLEIGPLGRERGSRIR